MTLKSAARRLNTTVHLHSDSIRAAADQERQAALQRRCLRYSALSTPPLSWKAFPQAGHRSACGHTLREQPQPPWGPPARGIAFSTVWKEVWIAKKSPRQNGANLRSDDEKPQLDSVFVSCSLGPSGASGCGFRCGLSASLESTRGMKDFYGGAAGAEESAGYEFRVCALHIGTRARVAVYDDLAAAPYVEDVGPAPARTFIEELAQRVFSLAAERGGSIPYTVVREVSENLMHAGFAEPVVSILDSGRTIRFSDQGPGIADKQRALLPGYSTATAEMKQVIRGVGSGLPLVRDFLALRGGSLTVEDNLRRGSVITVSCATDPDAPGDRARREPWRRNDPAPLAGGSPGGVVRRGPARACRQAHDPTEACSGSRPRERFRRTEHRLSRAGGGPLHRVPRPRFTRGSRV